ncbi:MAG: ribosome maturation factor RimM [Acidiferrobacterales bacterium]
MSSDRIVTLGRIVGLFGARGWVKVLSYSRSPEDILRYNPWLVRTEDAWHEYTVIEGRRHGKGVVVSLRGYVDRDQARALIGGAVAVPLSRLPALPEDEYYWAQLQGLRVENIEGEPLGVVSHLFETGANDVMVVMPGRLLNNGNRKGASLLIPYVSTVILAVDLDAGVIRVDWSAEL